MKKQGFPEWVALMVLSPTDQIARAVRAEHDPSAQNREALDALRAFHKAWDEASNRASNRAAVKE